MPADPAGGAWLPEGWKHPLRLDLTPTHHLRPIRAADIDLDYPAVMGSRDRLYSIFGPAWGWPPHDMTREQDRADLARHEAEAGAQRSFNYALFDRDETALLGCVYIDPPEKAGADADVSWWVIDAMSGTAFESALDAAVIAWVTSTWPFRSPRFIGHDLTWADWLSLPDTSENGP